MTGAFAVNRFSERTDHGRATVPKSHPPRRPRRGGTRTANRRRPSARVEGGGSRGGGGGGEVLPRRGVSRPPATRRDSGGRPRFPRISRDFGARRQPSWSPPPPPPPPVSGAGDCCRRDILLLSAPAHTHQPQHSRPPVVSRARAARTLMYIRFAGCLSVSARLPGRRKPFAASVRCSYHFTCRLRAADRPPSETAEQFGERCKRHRSRRLSVLFLCVI